MVFIFFWIFFFSFKLFIIQKSIHTFSKYFERTLPLYLFLYWKLFLFDSKGTISCINVKYKYTQSKYSLWTDRFIFQVLPSYFFLIVKWMDIAHDEILKNAISLLSKRSQSYSFENNSPTTTNKRKDNFLK